MPIFISAQAQARTTACISNLRQIGIGIAHYAADHNTKIPYGPKVPGFNNAGNFYPSTGSPTSLISLQDGQPVALGLLIDPYLASTPRVLFCPGADQISAQTELDKVGKTQAQCSYYYRHGGNTSLFDDPRAPLPDPPLQLGNLGDNRNGLPVRALVVDIIFRVPEALKSFGVITQTNHGGRVANILFTDGHVASRQNNDERFSVDARDVAQIRSTFDKILRVFEQADQEP